MLAQVEAKGRSASLRVGLLGAAAINRTVWPAIHAAGHRVTMMAASDVRRAEQQWAEVAPLLKGVVEPPHMSANYMDVVSSPNVDVVYVPLPVRVRDQWVRACIAHGKHVVGEKPAAGSVAELHAWLELMAPKRLLYMDGTMLSHGRRVHDVLARVKALGQVEHIDVQASFCGSAHFMEHDIRVKTDLEPHGALGDLGWYAIRWILHVMSFATPTEVSGRVSGATDTNNNSNNNNNNNEGGAIVAFDGELRFQSPVSGAADVTAAFHCSFTEAKAAVVRIHTTGGVVVIDDAINPTRGEHPCFRVETLAPADAHGVRTRHVEVVEASAPDATADYQVVQMWRDVGGCLVRLGEGEPLIIDAEVGACWGMYAYKTQAVMEQLHEAARQHARVPVEAAATTPAAASK